MSDRRACGPIHRLIPPGDSRERLVCEDCGYIAYANPKVVVGAVVEHDGRMLLCKRAIEPRVGFWTMPAGFLEERESVEEGAKREAHEEASCDIELDGLLAVYSVPSISQVQIFFRAHLATPHFAPGPESLEVKLFAWDEIPWGELAFPTVKWALDQYAQVRERREWLAFSNP